MVLIVPQLLDETPQSGATWHMGLGTVIFSPHVDDEVLGCFAFLKTDTHVVYGGIEDRPSVAVRTEELEASSAALGFSHESLDAPVNNYDASRLIGAFEAVLRDQQPETVLVPAPSYNQDHRAFYEAGMVATRPHDTNHRVNEVMIFEQPHSIIWPLDDEPTPNVFVSIDVDEKVAAYERYQSQVREHRSSEVIRAIAALRGAHIGERAAEAFTLKRRVIR